MNSRAQQRVNKRLRNRREKEERLDKRSGTGYKDLTPYNAVRHILNINAQPVLK